MIYGFRDRATEDIFHGWATKAARKALPLELWKVAGRRLDQLDSAGRLEDLRVPPGNRLESLTGSRADQHSIRINEQYRICFRWTESGPAEVEITDYH
jgi:proteic killer suppression protein